MSETVIKAKKSEGKVINSKSLEKELNEVKDNKVVNKSNEKSKYLLKKQKERKKLRNLVKTESKRIIKLVVPISLCMLLVVLSITFFPAYSNGIEEYASKHIGFWERKEASTADKIGSVAIVVAALLVIMIIVTFTMALILIYEFDRCINGFLMFAFGLYFVLFGTTYLTIAVIEYNIPIDWITVVLIIYNYTALGLIIFFIAGPKILKQIYLIWVSANLALLMILVLPAWTAWALMVVMAIWDCYAVLHKTGPLNKIFESMQKNNRPMPPLLYSTAVWMSTDSDDNSDIEIGLGDFVFYSLLVGKSFVSGDALIAIICYISILVGLAITLFILIQNNIPLPALPLSIALGVFANFVTIYTVIPFNDLLQEKLIFI